MITYSWNLGTTTNNSAEAYALLKGTQIAKERQINKLIIIGDSKMIIRYFVKSTNPKNSTLRRIIDRTRDTISSIHPCFYHVRRVNNWTADEQENKAIGKGTGHLEIQGRSTFLAPPPPPPPPPITIPMPKLIHVNNPPSIQAHRDLQRNIWSGQTPNKSERSMYLNKSRNGISSTSQQDNQGT
jgi:hypothetical protein